MIPSENPFNLYNQQGYQRWRAAKLAAVPQSAAALCVPIANPEALSTMEKNTLLENCRQVNLSFYRFTSEHKPVSPAVLLRFWEQLGLHDCNQNICADANGISWIQVIPKARYIPYTSKVLQWHTDGCYNSADKTIRSFAMHCISASATGGTNCYLDPEILYIMLRDENPRYISALSHPESLTIPANLKDGKVLRKAITGPALDCQDGLSLRYSERSRNICWRNNTTLQEALAFIHKVLRRRKIPKICYRLRSDEGVICNNVLHNRSAFADDPQQPRLLYRARFYNRIASPSS